METLIDNLQFSHNYWLVLLPCILMCLDIITGYYNAWKRKKISSSKMRDGLGKKLAELVYIIAGFVISIAFDMNVIAYFVSIYVVYMEIVSILENCKKLGVPIPTKIEEKLNNKEGE